ncbi:MAG: riboflavin synthase [Actinomycetota bacterium]|nr:riboflavin synthase [Actinomycetota bacterium]
MFTGIVTATGRVVRARPRKGGPLQLTIEARAIARALHKGDSVSVDGVCLTAVSTGRKRFETEAVEETLARTTLNAISRGDVVNLELALRPTDHLGGHFVQGHVDGTARLVRIEEEERSRRMWWEAGRDILRYVVMKGSVALNGVSLTVAGAGTSTFEVAVIPHTLETTTLGRLQVGDRANIEVDLIAKYVEKLTSEQDSDRLDDREKEKDADRLDDREREQHSDRLDDREKEGKS